MIVKNYPDLKVWQKAMDLVVARMLAGLTKSLKNSRFNTGHLEPHAHA